ncbi:hypothetical protein BN946_scf185008.g130, partial [Trametes cinnabarina]
QIDKPDALEWTRFTQRAQHVRCLDWNVPFSISLPALLTLSKHRPASHVLLPNLRQLVWHEPRPQYFQFWNLFLTPTLRDLQIQSISPEPKALLALFQHAAEVCKEVKILHLGIDTGRPPKNADNFAWLCGGEVGDAFTIFLEGLKFLRDYSADASMSAGCVQALARLPQLEMLFLKVGRHDLKNLAQQLPMRNPDSAAEEACFGSLRVLELHVPVLDATTRAVIGALQSCTLEDFTLVPQHPPDTATFRAHLEVISRASYSTSLTAIELDFDSTRREKEISLQTLDLGVALRPLYALPQIRTMKISGPVVTLSERTLSDIAAAWPALNVLALISTVVHPSASAYCPSLADLAPLACRCPKLSVLELHLSAIEVPTETKMTSLLGEGPSRCQLRYLAAYDAPIVNPARVAACLSRLFPALKNVEYYGRALFPRNGREVYEKNWKRVQDYSRGVEPPVNPLMHPLNE